MKKMLINASQSEEVRIALVEDQRLIDLDIEQRRNDNKKSNIYNGVISRIEHSLEACFINYGEGRDGFLPFKDIHPSFVDAQTQDEVKDKLKVGQKLIVQVAREERGNKGAALTTYVSIASTFLVLVPNNPDVEGISRRLSSEERDNLRAKLNNIGLRDNEGVIVRTAGTGCTVEELRYDLDILHYIWEQIQRYAREHQEVGILHHESETIIRVIRDYLTKDVEEIVTDTKDAFNKVQHYLNLVRPKSQPKLTHYEGNEGLFSAFKIESQIDSAFERTVQLKSGGAIVIDTTEALTAIDVNSARYTSGVDIETTAFNTNMEAAEEIARQLKIRDLGGLIVVDFIDMNSSAAQRKIEEKMRQETADDRARIQLTKISKFGLIEISRQRIRGSIAESVNHVCPRCCGTGFIRDNESLSLHIIRQANETANKNSRLAKLHILVPNEIATFLMNEKRDEVKQIEQLHNLEVYIIPVATMQTPHFKIYKVRKGDNIAKESLSYNLVEYYAEQERLIASRKSKSVDRFVDNSHSTSSVPDEHADKTFEARLEKAGPFIQSLLNQEEKKESLFSRCINWFKGLFKSKEQPPVVQEVPEKTSRSKSRKLRQSRRRTQATTIAQQDNLANQASEAQVTSTRLSKAERVSAYEQSQPEKQVVQVEQHISVKKVESGNAVEEVYSSESKRRKRSKKAQQSLDGDINPQQVKREVEARELQEAQESSSKSKFKAHLTPEYQYDFDDDVDTSKNLRAQDNQESFKNSKESSLDYLKTPVKEKRERPANKAVELVNSEQAQDNQVSIPKVQKPRAEKIAEDKTKQPIGEQAEQVEQHKANKEANKEVSKAEVNKAEINKAEVVEQVQPIESVKSKKKRNSFRQITLYLSKVPSQINQELFDAWFRGSQEQSVQHALPKLMQIDGKEGFEVSPIVNKSETRVKTPRKGTMSIGRLDKADFTCNDPVAVVTLANSTDNNSAQSSESLASYCARQPQPKVNFESYMKQQELSHALALLNARAISLSAQTNQEQAITEASQVETLPKVDDKTVLDKVGKVKRKVSVLSSELLKNNNLDVAVKVPLNALSEAILTTHNNIKADVQSHVAPVILHEESELIQKTNQSRHENIQAIKVASEVNLTQSKQAHEKPIAQKHRVIKPYFINLDAPKAPKATVSEDQQLAQQEFNVEDFIFDVENSHNQEKLDLNSLVLKKSNLDIGVKTMSNDGNEEKTSNVRTFDNGFVTSLNANQLAQEHQEIAEDEFKSDAILATDTLDRPIEELDSKEITDDRTQLATLNKEFAQNVEIQDHAQLLDCNADEDSFRDLIDVVNSVKQNDSIEENQYSKEQSKVDDQAERKSRRVDIQLTSLDSSRMLAGDYEGVKLPPPPPVVPAFGFVNPAKNDKEEQD